MSARRRCLAGLAIAALGALGAQGTAGAQDTQSASFYSLQLLSKTTPLKVGQTTTLGIGVRTMDGKSHRGARVCVTLPSAIRVVKPLHGGRRSSGKVCWKSFTAKTTTRVLDLRVRPRRAGTALRVVADLKAPDIVPATATWKVAVVK